MSWHMILIFGLLIGEWPPYPYQDFYNWKRSHQGVEGVIPSFSDACNENEFEIEKSPELNGLVTLLKLAA